jgi:hypothetical protein
MRHPACACVDLPAAEGYHQLKRRNYEPIGMLPSVTGDCQLSVRRKVVEY